MKRTNQRLPGLEQEAWQPRLATEADVPTGTKTRKRMEDVAADQAKHGDSCSANQADPDLTSFDDHSTGPPALPCTRDDALVDNGAAAPKPRLSPAEMRTQTVAGGLPPAGTVSTAMRTIFPRPFFSWSLREIKKRTSQIQPACPLLAEGYK